jgi:hypothetical protein
MAVRSLSVTLEPQAFIISNRGTETPDPFENTAILALVRNAFIWLSEYYVTDKERTAIADEMNSTLSMFDTVSIDNAQIRAPSRWDG